MTARRTILSRFRRRPRPTDPEPYTKLDHLDGLDTRLTDIQVLGRDRYAQCDETCTADCGHCKGRRFGPYALPTRYDAEWPDVIAAEAPGGDLSAMAAPGDWPEFSGWGEGYEIEPESEYMARHVMSDVAPVWVSWVAHRDARARAIGDMVHDLTTAIHAGSHLAITPTGCHLVGPLAHPPTPPVDEADVETLAGLLREHDDPHSLSSGTARRLLATGRVSVTR